MPSRVLYCRLCLTFAEGKIRHGKKWLHTLRFSPGRLALRERHRRSICCCNGTPLLLDCITLHLRACASLSTRGLRMCADSMTPSYLQVSGLLAGGGCGEKMNWSGYYKRGTGAATTIPSFRSYSDLKGSQPTDRDYLACLAWLTPWPSIHPLNVSLTGLSTWGQAMLGHWSQHTSETVDQTLSPDGMGKAGACTVPLRCELNLLGRPYRAGWVNMDLCTASGQTKSKPI